MGVTTSRPREATAVDSRAVSGRGTSGASRNRTLQVAETRLADSVHIFLAERRAVREDGECRFLRLPAIRYIARHGSGAGCAEAHRSRIQQARCLADSGGEGC